MLFRASVSFPLFNRASCVLLLGVLLACSEVAVAQVATCASVQPPSVVTSQPSGTHEFRATGVQGAIAVNFAAWSQLNGTDDLVWYVGVNDDGNWRATVNLANHRPGNPDYGLTYVDVWMWGGVVWSYCGGATITRTAPPPTCTGTHFKGLVTSKTSGTEDFFADGVQYASEVYFATWSQVNGQDDLEWYRGVNLGGQPQTWKGTVDMGNHRPGNPDYGLIYVDIWLFGYQNAYCGDTNFTRVPNQPPAAVSVSPPSGSGFGPQIFQFTYSDPNGYADLAWLYGRINSSASDIAACSFLYHRATNYLHLWNDAGTALLGPVTLGNQLTNSQCTLVTGSTAPSGNNLTLNLTITFNLSFGGSTSKTVSMQAVDASSASSGWQPRGSWTVPPPLTIATASPLPAGTWGVAYSPVTLAATGGTPPYSWSHLDPVTEGNLLPSGLSLSPAGVLSGTPTRAGQTYGFWIKVTDSLGATDTKDFTLAIGPAVQPIYGPSRLELGLSYMPFDEYDFDHPANPPTNPKFPKSCPPDSKIRGCFQTVLAKLRAQGVSGVRIFFQLCGPDSTPLLGCGEEDWTKIRYKGNLNPPDFTWINRVKDFFYDVKTAGIQNITLTPAHHAVVGGVPYSKPKSQVSSAVGDYTTLCGDAPETIYFYPTAPLGYKKISDTEYHPIGQHHNQAYNCAPINPYFVGWQNQYDVINAMLAAAAEKQLTVYELDFEQELDIMNFPALARFIVDNAHGGPGQEPNVRNALRYYMGLYGFDPGRVTWAAPWENSTLAGYNCPSVYAGWARTMGADQIASAIGAGWIGIPTNRDYGSHTGYLSCYGDTSDMFRVSSYGTQPNILDVHVRPCVGGPNTHCVLNDAAAAVQSEARIDFDAIVNYIARFPSTATVMLGETHSNTDNGSGALCEGGTLNAPAETVAGFNQSTLAGRSVVFRPWMQLQWPSGFCHKYPGNQRVNFQGGGPYTPTQQ